MTAFAPLKTTCPPPGADVPSWTQWRTMKVESSIVRSVPAPLAINWLIDKEAPFKSDSVAVFLKVKSLLVPVVQVELSTVMEVETLLSASMLPDETTDPLKTETDAAALTLNAPTRKSDPFSSVSVEALPSVRSLPPSTRTWSNSTALPA